MCKESTRGDYLIMLHLFNNVFVEQDSKLTVFYKVVVISSVYNTDMKVNPNCLYCTDTLDELLGDRTLESFLRELMQHEEKVVIYANNEAFARIIACWLKSSTNMQKADYDFFVDCYKYKCVTYSKHNTQLFEFMKAYWDNAPTYNFSDVDFSPSFEFAIASAFYNPNFAKKQKLISLLSRFIKREYEYVILEARKYIDQYALDDDVQATLGATENTYDINGLKNLPRMAIYKEPYFREEVEVPSFSSYFPGKASKIDISLCSDADLQELCNLSDEIIFLGINSAPPYDHFTYEATVSHFEARGWTYLNSVKNGLLSEAEYLAVLEEILQERMNLIHTPLDLRESILYVIIPFFRSIKQKNNLDRLFRFTLK